MSEHLLALHGHGALVVDAQLEVGHHALDVVDNEPVAHGLEAGEGEGHRIRVGRAEVDLAEEVEQGGRVGFGHGVRQTQFGIEGLEPVGLVVEEGIMLERREGAVINIGSLGLELAHLLDAVLNLLIEVALGKKVGLAFVIHQLLQLIHREAVHIVLGSLLHVGQDGLNDGFAHIFRLGEHHHLSLQFHQVATERGQVSEPLQKRVELGKNAHQVLIKRQRKGHTRQGPARRGIVGLGIEVAEQFQLQRVEIVEQGQRQSPGKELALLMAEARLLVVEVGQQCLRLLIGKEARGMYQVEEAVVELLPLLVLRPQVKPLALGAIVQAGRERRKEQLLIEQVHFL